MIDILVYKKVFLKNGKYCNSKTYKQNLKTSVCSPRVFKEANLSIRDSRGFGGLLFQKYAGEQGEIGQTLCFMGQQNFTNVKSLRAKKRKIVCPNNLAFSNMFQFKMSARFLSKKEIHKHFH
ncbi:MAG: hypothetical protein OM95_01670 [Bdellovibrio sp. ArHS]|uniref:hypothetical protein n=1 Tax=Bdellovibrio sp. ArHS TaxID=1569284 RepID=UPI0005827A35|nr:hypothetical protein [Bdellovibrio sp. ArHS]KHD89803.1 MAG: hypothetical protein OM95_01670 [Bdellovibrio sp. ArHS]